MLQFKQGFFLRNFLNKDVWKGLSKDHTDIKEKRREEKRKDVQMLYTYFVYVTTSPGGHFDLYADFLIP